jgi:hypothetical protein
VTPPLLYSLAFVGLAVLIGTAILLGIEALARLLDWWDKRKDKP